MPTHAHPVPSGGPDHDSEGLHPSVYRTIIALTVSLVLSAWTFFNRGAYAELILAVVTLFFAIAVGIPLLIGKTWQHNAPPPETRTRSESFGAWASQDFATWTGRLSGREAAMQILLPIAAVSISMFVFGLVFYLDVPHAG